MSVLSTVAQAATIASGLVSAIVLAAAFIDAVTSGWVRRRARRWLGIEGLREDHHDTQVFLLDLGSAHNRLSERVCEEHNVREDRPPRVDTGYYARRLEEEDGVDRGDFLSEDD